MESAQSGLSGIAIADSPVRIPGLDACTACFAGKSAHLPHEEGPGRASEYLLPGQAGGRAASRMTTLAVYTRPLRPQVGGGGSAQKAQGGRTCAHIPISWDLLRILPSGTSHLFPPPSSSLLIEGDLGDTTMRYEQQLRPEIHQQ